MFPRAGLCSPETRWEGSGKVCGSADLSRWAVPGISSEDVSATKVSVVSSEGVEGGGGLVKCTNILSSFCIAPTVLVGHTVERIAAGVDWKGGSLVRRFGKPPLPKLLCKWKFRLLGNSSSFSR
uniref:Uncharacterized protein n=1 Tax=Sphaerodactylus townsendi TaxID=933632 RepID=A0ACB8E5W5_9SAUR